MADPRSLARHLRQCHAERRAPRLEAADAKVWFLALEELIRRGALAEAAYAAPHMVASFPDSRYIGRLAMLLERVPPAVADPMFSTFVNRGEREVQVAPRAGATTALLAFCGRHGSLGLPIPIMHRWFGGLGVHVVYLRDPAGELYTDGIPTLGRDRAGTIRALQAVVTEIGAARTVCYGNSNGGYAALLYGLEMRAEAVLAVNTLAIFPADRIQARLGARARSYRPGLPDLRSLYAGARARPRAHLVHSAGNADDAASAATMAGIPGVTIEAVPDSSGHDAHMLLIERGRFGALLQGLIRGWPGQDEGAAAR